MFWQEKHFIVIDIRWLTATDWTWSFLLACLEMNAEVGLLVLILYFNLFIDLYTSLGKLFLANGKEHAKKSWQFKRHLMEQKRTKNLASFTTVRTCTFKDDKRKTDLPEITFHREMSKSYARENGWRAAMQKSRLWGRGWNGTELTEVINGGNNGFLKLIAAILRPCNTCSKGVLSPFINFHELLDISWPAPHFQRLLIVIQFWRFSVKLHKRTLSHRLPYGHNTRKWTNNWRVHNADINEIDPILYSAILLAIYRKIFGKLVQKLLVIWTRTLKFSLHILKCISKYISVTIRIINRSHHEARGPEPRLRYLRCVTLYPPIGTG